VNGIQDVRDAEVMVNIGTLNSGAAKVSIPIMCAQNLGMITPANTYPGLTKKIEGAVEANEPDVDYIEGLSPAISIDQKSTSRNPRSTVGTVTEIYDYLRLLYARVGRTYCAKCGREVKKDTVDEVADTILALDPETRLQVLFPLQRPGLELQDVAKPSAATRAKKGAARPAPAREKRETGSEPIALTDALKTRLFDLRKAGFNWLYQSGEIYEFSTPESLLDINFSEPVFVLVDRLVVILG